MEYSSFYYPEPWRCLIAVFLPFILFVYGLWKKSVSSSGILAGLMVGFILTLSSLCFFASLLVLFIAGSYVTKYRSHLKRTFEDDFKEGGQRGWKSVVCNTGIASIVAVIYMMEVGTVEMPINFAKRFQPSWLGISVLSALAGCCGDTFASEIGSVVGIGQPFLVKSFRRVPRGTNGAVSVAGTLASAVGGLLTGLGYFCAIRLTCSSALLQHSPPQWPIVVVGLIAGLTGSFIDSLLGSLFQYSGCNKTTSKIVEKPGKNIHHINGMDILDNHSVNLLASVCTALLIPHLSYAYLWPLCKL